MKQMDANGRICMSPWFPRRIVEKPYYVIFASCWVCALMQQLIDTSRYYEERTEELSKTLLGEWFSSGRRLGWMAGSHCRSEMKCENLDEELRFFIQLLPEFIGLP